MFCSTLGLMCHMMYTFILCYLMFYFLYLYNFNMTELTVCVYFYGTIFTTCMIIGTTAIMWLKSGVPVSQASFPFYSDYTDTCSFSGSCSLNTCAGNRWLSGSLTMHDDTLRNDPTFLSQNKVKQDFAGSCSESCVYLSENVTNFLSQRVC